jgi:hypothetical protein
MVENIPVSFNFAKGTRRFMRTGIHTKVSPHYSEGTDALLMRQLLRQICAASIR